MKIFAVCLLIFSTVSAQTPESIQTDFDGIFDKRYTEALRSFGSFVTDLGTVFDERVNLYVKVHEDFIDQLQNISSLANLNLTSTNEKIITDGIASLNLLIEGYRSVLHKDIFVNELNKHMNMLNVRYLANAQMLIDQLKSQVAMNAAGGECWAREKDEVSSTVKTGFLSAHDAAKTALSNLNMTLNINEFIVKVTVDSNNMFLSSCQFPGVEINSCVSSFLSIAQITLPINVNMWASSTENALTTNFQLAETLINSAAANAMNGVYPVIARIAACITSIY